jgi:hypothetical protein
MDSTISAASPLTLAATQLEQACRMAKGLHLLKARLQVVHYRMLGAERLPERSALAREWADELSLIMREGRIPAAVEQALAATVQQLRAA